MARSLRRPALGFVCLVCAAVVGAGLLAGLEAQSPLAERDNTNIVHWSNFSKGGHYASLERPDDVTADLRTFFRNL